MPMKRAGWILTAGLAMAGAGCGNPASVASNPAAPPAAPSAPAPWEMAGNPAATDILSVLSVEHEVDVVAELDGVVVEIAKDEGSRVKGGEVLARLDDASVTAELEKARADLQVAENNVKYQEAELKAKEAGYRRQQLLRADGLSSQADLEQAEFLAKGAEYDLASWKSNVVKNQAEVHRLEIERNKMRIRAPFDGVVARRYLRQGQGVAKGEKCFRVSQLGPLRVEFQVPETSARRPVLGDTVQLSLAGEAGRTYAARIVKLSPMIDASSDSYDVTAQLTGSDLGALRPGMGVRISWPRTTSNPKP
jgi:membrane fusion protein, multidrug efflux system